VGLAAALIAVFVIGYVLGRRDGAARAQANSLASAMVILVGLATAATAQDTAAAMADRALFPPEIQPFIYYADTSAALNDTERTMQEVALKLIVPHVSRQPILERCLPQKVKDHPHLWRLNLIELKWDLKAWLKVVATYPYHPQGFNNPLVVRVDWLLPTITDAAESTAYYDLLLGAKPKNRAEVFAKLGVTDDVRFQYGQIAGGSPVSKSGVRFIRSLAVLRGWSYLTEDVKKLAGNNDPLKFPIGAFPHDGEELLVATPKIHLGTGTRGVTLNGFLFDGKGNTVDRAPVDLVEDYTATRGFTEIRAGISCFSCHPTGPNGPSSNVLREAFESGVKGNVYSYEDKEAIQAYHGSDPKPQMRRDSEDYCSILRLQTGCEPQEAFDAFRAVVDSYDAAVTLERAAAELYVSAADLPLAIGWMREQKYDLGGWILAMAEDPKHTVPREQFDERVLTLRIGCDAWRTTQ
jgi:hypothetical protein